MNRGIGQRGIGLELTVIDPAAREIRFFQPG
jgi:hypothetical protein